jgi:hypothetical protein
MQHGFAILPVPTPPVFWSMEVIVCRDVPGRNEIQVGPGF